MSILDYYIFSIFDYLGSKLGYRTLLLDLMSNYIYNAYICSISSSLDNRDINTYFF